MEYQLVVAHDIPGRIRLVIPSLGERKDYKSIEQLFSSVKGISGVRIQPVIHSMTLEYDTKLSIGMYCLNIFPVFFNKFVTILGMT
jgi:hypothetical protein